MKNHFKMCTNMKYQYKVKLCIKMYLSVDFFIAVLGSTDIQGSMIGSLGFCGLVGSIVGQFEGHCAA